MKKHGDITRSMALSLFLLVNGLFAIKYLERVTSWHVPLALVVLTGYFLLWHFRQTLSDRLSRFRIGPWKLLAGYFLLSAIAFHFVPKETLRVDRWSIIAAFWDAFFEGRYAYSGTSFDGNPPASLPFYFLLALPFHLIGETGWFSLLGIALLTFVAVRNRIPHVTALVLLLGCSLFYLWEVVARSNLFTVSMLTLGAMLLFGSYHRPGWKKDVLFGILFGCIVSTRNILILPLLVIGIDAMKQQKLPLRSAIVMAVSALLTVVLTFIPFVYGHFDTFRALNPFTIQSDLLFPWWSGLVFIVSAVLAGWFCGRGNVYFASSLILFGPILLYAGLFTVGHGWREALFNNKVDISYFILSTPFALWHLFARAEQKHYF